MLSAGIYGAEVFETENFIDESIQVYDQGKEKQKEAIVAYCLVAFVWAIGASSTNNSSKEKFSIFFQDLTENLNKKHPKY